MSACARSLLLTDTRMGAIWSYHSGHSFDMPLIVSGAPLTAARVLPPGREDLGEWAIASHGRILVPQGVWWFQYVNILYIE